MGSSDVEATLSVRDVLAITALRGAEVLAGHAGLGRRVRTVNVMEVPDILPWVRREQLLLTTAYPLRHDPGGLAALVRQLDERGLAGIFLKPERYIDRIPADMVEQADRLSFPLVAVPTEASFSDIINATLTALLDNQAARLQRARDIHDRFNEIVLTGGGFMQIASALSEALGRPVVVVDGDGRIRGSAGDRVIADLPALPATLHADGGDDTGMRLGRFVVQPIRADGELLGAIFTTAEPVQLTDDGWEALQYAATVSALHQVQLQALAAEEGRSKIIYLEQLINGEPGDWPAAVERGAAFGWDLRTARTAVVIVDEGELPAAMTTARRMRTLAGRVRNLTDERTIAWERSSEVAVLLPADELSSGGVRAAVQQLRSRLSEGMPQARLTVGFGRAALTPEELPRSFAEARRALTVGRWSGGTDDVYGFVDLGVERLLAGCDDGELSQYRDELIGPLLRHDVERGTDLLASLETYLLTRNVAESARRRYVHHNTMRNQLYRIEQLLGPFLDDGERCLSLALAVRVHRYADISRSA